MLEGLVKLVHVTKTITYIYWHGFFYIFFIFLGGVAAFVSSFLSVHFSISGFLPRWMVGVGISYWVHTNIGRM